MLALSSSVSISEVLFAEVTQAELTSDSAGFAAQQGRTMEQVLHFQNRSK